MNNSAIRPAFNNVLPLLNSELSTRTMIDAQQKSAEDKLRQDLQNSEAKYLMATEITSDGIWAWDLSSDRVEYSARWKSMIGCGEQEINHSLIEWLVRVHPTDVEKLKRHLTECWQGKVERFEVEYSLLHRDGEYRLMRCKCIAVANLAGVVCQLIGAQTDLTQDRQIKARLNHQFDHDRLTKLPNRQLFIEKLQELSRLKQHPEYSFGILCLDLDRFKNINHNFGDEIGDRILVEIVRQLESCLRPQDILARLGGDEFAILLTSFVNEQRPAAIASQIQQQLSTPIKIAEYSILVSTSIGIATPDTSDLSANTTNGLLQSLQNAELAMYQAKARGQACNQVFESRLHLQSLEKTRSEDDLRKALEQGQFVLYYQPLVQLVDQQLIGFEALIRWEHPVRGLISPGDFIPLAEATGLIIPIGWWVLRSACEQMVQWQKNSAAKSIFVSVNITGKQFSQPYAGDIIAQILMETGLNPKCLKLEITESEIIENIALVLPTVERLKSLGVQLSMDDFGTGYSSLSYLHCLPVDTLKIDRSFIQGMESDRHQLELVKTIIKLAEVFELDLIAEGIETQTQCAELIELQCKYGQGYLFSKPVNSAIAATFFNS
ncbi:MAG: EAL domain-containing protein [Pleurocapsa minor HA4230-MV1]|nr:EAL domain-containing protein [Pleurocapsa minor HA4230-MV1]